MHCQGTSASFVSLHPFHLQSLHGSLSIIDVTLLCLLLFLLSSPPFDFTHCSSLSPTTFYCIVLYFGFPTSWFGYSIRVLFSPQFSSRQSSLHLYFDHKTSSSVLCFRSCISECLFCVFDLGLIAAESLKYFVCWSFLFLPPHLASSFFSSFLLCHSCPLVKWNLKHLCLRYPRDSQPPTHLNVVQLTDGRVAFLWRIDHCCDGC